MCIMCIWSVFHSQTYLNSTFPLLPTSLICNFNDTYPRACVLLTTEMLEVLIAPGKEAEDELRDAGVGVGGAEEEMNQEQGSQ